MDVETVTFEAPRELIAAIDEIASNREVDRAVILRDALSEYLAEYQDLQADLEEARRHIDAGHFTLHEDVVREFQATAEKSRAA